ncbi:unnamed protein product [Ectocarpus sp. CCAP 1310/34]|nr:unnamed protein product [Ectocarpus sp. CCAP 1310/34]
MHVTAVANAAISLFYFLLVLLVEARWHEISVLVMILNQITVSVCGFSTVRMWIYTNDTRLMQGSITILRISAALEKKNGQRLSYLVLSTGPVVATVLALLGRTEAAAKLVAVTFIMLIVVADTSFWIFGRALLRAIDASLQNSRKRAMESVFGKDRRESVLAVLGGTEADEEGGRRGSSISAGEGGGRLSRKWSSGRLQRRGSWWGGEGRDESELGGGELQAAKRKVRWVMVFCALMSLEGYAILLLSILSKYGTTVPLILFGVQMAIFPLVWHAFNIQLHAGRSRGSAIGRRSSSVDQGGRRYVVPAVGGGIRNNVGQVNTTSQHGQQRQQQQQQKHQKWIGGVGTNRRGKYGPALRGHAVAPTETDDAAVATDAVTGETNTNAPTGTTHPADGSMNESVSAPPCRGVKLQSPMERSLVRQPGKP